MDYVANYPNAFPRFHASDMILHIENAAYSVQTEAKSRISGYFRLESSLPRSSHHPSVNGAVLVEFKTLRYVVALAAEVETVGVFHNA